jgi:hypothetical protein
MKYLTLLLIAAMTLSCNPSRKLDKLNKKYPELLAKFCKDTFPCVTSKVDTVTNIEYEFIELQCPTNDYNKTTIDTIWLTKTKTHLITGPAVVATEYKINTITKTIKDSAEIVLCNLELNEVNKKCTQYIEDNRLLKNKVSAKNRWIMWLIIALLLMIIGNIIQLKK